ncbi:polyketide synthase [Nodularia spumigena CENA596]|uniref:Polyketide synthase n=1 Tax=Nodularia spumigena CENA596 TaxID=1819295 RepID=A0A166K8T4_NODSP|nr:type I polyketide synthase [Nodularia spumigena]KZL50739.1 polyketide synthase [Nodularia spumigena CENA596]
MTQDYRTLMQNALKQIQDLKGQLKTQNEPIAIVGIACRLPGGADTPEALWQLLRNKCSVITEIPSDRWNINTLYHNNPSTPGKMSTRHGGFIGHLQEFDADFFNIAPREAISLDPQQRLLLEITWEALENTGILPEQLIGSQTGVFIGISSNDYSTHLLQRPITDIDAYLATGNSHSTASGRISYILGLTGPSLAVDTACSSSLVAVHLACQSLRQGECQLAVAGGVNRILCPEYTINFSQARMLAADGKCKTFDAKADGFVRSEGCGVIILEKLSDALAAKHPILAVIRGSAVNQDGRSSGLTVPNGPAQQAVIRQALKNATLQPSDITYIEAHGTGTALGDPIEIGALGAVFSESHQKSPLLVGSLKTNIGHLEAAAGIAGLIKVVLALKYGEIPPHLHFEQPNPHIPWEQFPIHIPTTCTPWHGKKIAGVSSFGFSGTNAHVILSKNDSLPLPRGGLGRGLERPLQILTLSAKTETALQQLAKNYINHLQDIDWADICYSANTGRSKLEYRLAIIADSLTTAQEKLNCFINSEATANIFTNRVNYQSRPKIAFLFTGQGSQYQQMGFQLYHTAPLFRETIDKCCQLLLANSGLDLQPLFLGKNNQNFNELLSQTLYTQPALFILEYALCQLWLSWGIKPDFLIGHSIGEYVAACIAGVFSLEDGLKIIANRARLMQQLPQGKMVAVIASASQIEKFILPYNQQVSIAAINAPNNTVISGETSAIEQIITVLTAQKIKSIPLSVSHAFHSPMMKEMLGEFEEILHTINFHPPKYQIISNVTGNLINSEIATPEYWCRHICQPVQFLPGIETLIQQDCTVFIEIGAKPTLLQMTRSIIANQEKSNIELLPTLQLGQQDWQVILSSIAALYAKGVKFNWHGFEQNYQRQRIDLPNYPFQRKRYWVDINPENNNSYSNTNNSIHPLLGEKLNLAKSTKIYFQQQLSDSYPVYLQHHRVFNQIILPGAAYLEMALAAGKEIFKDDKFCLETISFQQPCILNPDNSRNIQLILNNNQEFEIVSAEINPVENNWITHATGKIKPHIHSPQNQVVNFVELQNQFTKITDIANFYENLKQVGIDYGETFQAITQIWHHENQALAEIHLPIACNCRHNYQFHPIVLDACLQTIAAIFYHQSIPSIYLPIGVDKLTILQPIGEKVGSLVKLIPQQTTSPILIADIQIFTPDGQVIAAIEGLQLKAIESENLVEWKDWLYEIEWRLQPLIINCTSDSSLTSPVEIAEKIAPQFTQLLTTDEIQRYAQFLPKLEELSLAYIIQALHTFSSSSPQNGKVAPQYEQLYTHLSTLQKQNEHNFENPQNLQTELKTQYPETTAELTLIERCGTNLAKVLRGECNPLEILFPNGNLTTLTQLYQNSPGAKVMNTLVQQAVNSALEKLPPGEKVRIVEIGAGTGGTTAYVLPQLANKSVEYVFTDISPVFIAKARRQFSDYGFVSYQTLNIEQPLANQDFNVHSFDIVIAANVLHATENLTDAVTNIKSLLRNQGLLILLEGTRPSAWIDLIFGLTEGWWRFQDKNLRPYHPLISTSTWKKLLQTNGFTNVVNITPDSILPEVLAEQSVIVSQFIKEINSLKEWLIIADLPQFATGIAQQLQLQQESAITLKLSDNIREFLHQPSSQSIKHIIYIAGCQDNINECNHVLHLVQTLIQTQHYPINLWLVTQDAINPHTITGLSQSSLWGMGKVISLEHPELNCRCVDLDPTQELITQIQNLVTEITHPGEEKQISLHTSGRKVARLTRFTDQSLPNQPYHLTITKRGVLASLKWQPFPRRQPQPEEVEIQVKATGLNFIDVLDALGLLPFQRNWFGVECAGEVVAVGEGVTQFGVGDAVLALAADSFSQYVTTNANYVIAKPNSLSFAAAATIPANFLTAAYSLWEVGKIQPRQRILIHAATGGTGMAALQIAQAAGLEVFATASPGKWETLRAFGIEHIFNSRTLNFAEEIQEITHGEGVDIVFNSLSGEFIPASLSVLKPQGQFIEIGKRGVWNAQQVAQVKPHVSYHLVDLMSVAQQEPGKIQTLLHRLMEKFNTGEVQSLPQTIFPATKIVEALQMMQQAKHIGKIIITHAPTEFVKPQATYLITGGMGGLGLRVARWLVEKGAKYLVLLGRNQPNTEAKLQIQALAAADATIITTQIDVSQKAELAAVLADIQQNYPPLRGVIHAAGVLDDGVLQQLNLERLQGVMSPKVTGAENLHLLTQNIPLDYFIMFSSAASLLGSPGQANHVAANTFLDALAQYRRHQGLPALSINWGVWSDIGAATQGKIAEQMSLRGISGITPNQGIDILEFLLTQSSRQVGVIPVNWSELLKQRFSSPFLSDFYHKRPATSNQNQTSQLIQQIQSLGVKERIVYLKKYLQTEVSQVLGSSSAQLPDVGLGFFDMGMDSLMMVELRSRLEAGLNQTISSTILFEYPHINALAEYMATELLAKDSVISPRIEQKSFTPLDNFSSEEGVGLSITAELEALELMGRQPS